MESPGHENEFYETDDDTASIHQDPLLYALTHYSLDDLAALETTDDDGLDAVRIQAAEYVARQFLNQHCPTWSTFLLEAIVSSIDYRRPVRTGVLPGVGAGKNRAIVYEHRAAGEAESLWATRDMLAHPLDAGIAAETFIQEKLVPRVRIPIAYTQDPETPALVCFAKPDPDLSGHTDQVVQVFVPKSSAWTEGTSGISILTRSAFATLLGEVRGAFAAILQIVPSWSLARLIEEDLDRMHKTTTGAKRPSSRDKAAIQLAMRAVRNWSGTNSTLMQQMAELDYVYRRYEVLR